MRHVTGTLASCALAGVCIATADSSPLRGFRAAMTCHTHAIRSLLGAAFLAVAAGCERPTIPTAVQEVNTAELGASADRTLNRGNSGAFEGCDADNGGLTLPSGFCAVVVARHVGLARHMAVRDNGDLYVALDPDPISRAGGGILALRDNDGDGRADEQARFGSTGGNGIDIVGNELYFAPDDRVERYRLEPDALVPGMPPVTIVSGLVSNGDHHRKTVKISADGATMFVNIGSEGNSCQVENRVDFSPGIDPCPELTVRAGVWRFSATQEGQTLADGERYATETRNMNALAINPLDGELYGAQNGRDQLFDNWPNLFTARDDALLPSEELFLLVPGHLYGWPYCYWDGRRRKKVLAPEYGGNGRLIGRCAQRAAPIASYPAHWAPLGMTFYSRDQFPQRYRDGLFIANHGSRFDPSLQPAGPGYNVVFQRWRAGKPVGKWQEFAGGFARGDFSPTGAAHRPVDVAVAPDGSMYISDDKNGFIWRVRYVGNSRGKDKQ